MSNNELLINKFLKEELVEFCLKLFEKAKKKDINIFCLNYASALMANILHSGSAVEYYEFKVNESKKVYKYKLNF